MRGRPAPVRTGKDNEHGQPIYRLGARAGAWSGASAPPAIGDTVNVRLNGLGAGRVTSHFIEHGYLGVRVLFDSPPAWYVKQNGRNHPGHVFGAELGELDAPTRPWRASMRDCGTIDDSE